ncbi:MAG: FxLYD domain-containing protein [Clostridia bacterium]
MAYMDIWIYNSRPRIKVFLCYFLIFITVFIFSDVMIYLYTKSMYKPMEKYEVNVETLEVKVSTAEASNVNGNVIGTIKNNTQKNIIDEYLRFDFYTPRNVNVGTKYLKINELRAGEEKKFEMGFRYDNVTSVKISMAQVDDIHNATPEELEIIPPFGPAGLLQLLILGRLFA